jgi:hypothetical protein
MKKSWRMLGINTILIIPLLKHDFSENTCLINVSRIDFALKPSIE